MVEMGEMGKKGEVEMGKIIGGKWGTEGGIGNIEIIEGRVKAVEAQDRREKV